MKTNRGVSRFCTKFLLSKVEAILRHDTIIVTVKMQGVNNALVVFCSTDSNLEGVSKQNLRVHLYSVKKCKKVCYFFKKVAKNP